MVPSASKARSTNRSRCLSGRSSSQSMMTRSACLLVTSAGRQWNLSALPIESAALTSPMHIPASRAELPTAGAERPSIITVRHPPSISLALSPTAREKRQRRHQQSPMPHSHAHLTNAPSPSFRIRSSRASHSAACPNRAGSSGTVAARPAEACFCPTRMAVDQSDTLSYDAVGFIRTGGGDDRRLRAD